MIAGFGNLRGKMECWDIQNNIQKISEPEAPDTTHFEWCPDGVHYVWGTTAPRLRVGNGWKVSHYHGTLKHDYPYPAGEKSELWQVGYQPNNKLKPQIITKPSVLVQKQQESSKPKGYVPPHARGRSDYKSKIREDEKPSNPNEKLEAVINQKNNQKSGIKEPKLSATALKNKKKREAKKGQASGVSTPDPAAKPDIKPENVGTGGGGGGPPSEQEKELRKLKKKLDAVEKLKKRLEGGEALEKNQLEKIKTEKDILSQIEQLQLS